MKRESLPHLLQLVGCSNLNNWLKCFYGQSDCIKNQNLTMTLWARDFYSWLLATRPAIMCPIKADKIRTKSLQSYCFSAAKWLIAGREFISAYFTFCTSISFHILYIRLRTYYSSSSRLGRLVEWNLFVVVTVVA